MELHFTKAETRFNILPEFIIISSDKKRLIMGTLIVSGKTSIKYLKTLFRDSGKISVTDSPNYLYSKNGPLTSLDTEGCSIDNIEILQVNKHDSFCYRVSFKSKDLLNTVPGFAAETFLSTSSAEKDFKEIIIPALPVPIEKEWQQDFFNIIKKDKTFTYRHDLTDFENRKSESSIISIKLDIESLVKTLLKTNSAGDFREKYKRTPNFEPLLSVVSPKTFDLKGWLSFFTKDLKLTVETAFENRKEEDFENLINLFEIVQDKDLLTNPLVLESIHVTPTISLAVGLVKAGDQRDKYISSFRSLLNFVLHCDNSTFTNLELTREEYVSRVISVYSALFVNKAFVNIKNKNWKAIFLFLDKVLYSRIPAQLEELAMVCSRAGVSEELFLKKYAKLYPKSKQNADRLPKQYPTVSGSVSDLNWEIIDAGNPRAWVVGLETNCCQHLGSLGGPCVIYMANNVETSGIVRVFNKKGKTIAQSFMWIVPNQINPDTNIMCMDNIEVLGGELKLSIVHVYENIAKEVLKRKMFKITEIVVGGGYSDIDLSNFAGLVPKNFKAKVPSTLGYTDASNSQYYITK